MISTTLVEVEKVILQPASLNSRGHSDVHKRGLELCLVTILSTYICAISDSIAHAA